LEAVYGLTNEERIYYGFSGPATKEYKFRLAGEPG
jgi:hypothetical protein